VITCSNCTAVNGISSFPINSIPIYTWTATTGVWNSAGSDYRSVYSSKVVLASSGISINEGSGSSTTVSVDQSVVSLRVSVPANSSSTCTTGTFAASSSYYYFCISTNTWVRAALATF
jgi:hypothetical protein